MNKYGAFVSPVADIEGAVSPDLCAAVVQLLQSRDDMLKPAAGNRRMMRSDDQFFHWQAAPVIELARQCHMHLAKAVLDATDMTRSFFESLVFDYHSWVQIEHKGAFVPYQSATNCSWCGWLCLDDGGGYTGDPESGLLVLHDPRINASQALDDVAPKYRYPLGHGGLKFQLKSGQLLLAPSYVPQESFAYMGDKPRIMVGFRAWIRHQTTIPMLPKTASRVQEVPLVAWGAHS